MQNDIQTLLTSSVVEDRKEAIRLLRQKGGDEAMFQLAMLFKYDPDPEVRQLAVQAGKYLKQQAAGAQSSVVTTQEVRAVFSQQPENPVESKPPTMSRRTQEAKPPTQGDRRNTQELKPPTQSDRRNTQELKPPTQSDRRNTQELKPPTQGDRRNTQELKPPTQSGRTTQERPATQPRRATQEFRPVTPPPVEPDDDVLDMLDDEVPDYEYVPVSWQDEDKARGFVAAANMMYNEAKLKAAADYLRRALETNPNLRRDDSFVTTVARITERPKAVAIDQLMNPPDKRTMTQEAKPVGLGWFGGGGGTKKKKLEAARPGDLTWRDVSLDLGAYFVIFTVFCFIALSLIVNDLRDPITQATRITGTVSPEIADTFTVRTAGELVQVWKVAVDHYTPPYVLAYAIGFGIGSLIWLLVLLVSIHLAATIAMLGFGSFNKLIRRMTWFETLFELFTWFIVFSFVHGVLKNVALDIAAGKLDPAQSIQFYVERQSLSTLGTECISIFLLRFISSFLIAGVYDFGVVRGCITQFVASIIQSILTSIVLTVLIQVLVRLVLMNA